MRCPISRTTPQPAECFMSSHCLKTATVNRVLSKAALAALPMLLIASSNSCVRTAETNPVKVLRVCADPNNLPFSNERLEGFENKIAELLGNEMGATVKYTWWAQRRGF